MDKYKKINRSDIVQLEVYQSAMQWLEENNRNIITVKDLWKICELAANKVSDSGHLKTKTITVIDEPISKTMARIDKLIKKYNL